VKESLPLFCFALLCIVSPIKAIPIPSDQEILHLREGYHLYSCQDEELKIDNFIEKNSTKLDKYKQNVDLRYSLGFQQNVHWLDVELENETDSDLDRYLLIKYPLLEEIDFYHLDGTNVIRSFRTGRKNSFSERFIKSRNFVFPIDIKRKSKVRIILRVRTDDILLLPIYILNDKLHFEEEKKEYLFFGLFTGVLAVMVFYNLFLYLSIREKSFLFYSTFIFCLGLGQLADHGFAYEYLWPNSPVLNRIAPIMLGNASALFALLFTLSIFYVDMRRYKRIRIFFIVLCGLIIINHFIILIDLSLGALINAVAALVSIFSVFFLSFHFVLKRKKTATYFFIAWSVFLFSACTYYLLQLGYIEYSFNKIQILQYGSTFEATILALLLGNKFKDLMKREEFIRKFALEERNRSKLRLAAQELNQLKQREEVFMDIHDAIGSVIVDIKLEVSKLNPEKKVTQDQIDRLFRLAKQAREGLKDRIYLLEDWKVFEDDPLEGIRLLMIRRYHSGGRFFTLDFDSSLEDILKRAFDLEKRKILFYLILEIINNDLKYGKGESLWQLRRDSIKGVILFLRTETDYKSSSQTGKGTLNIVQRVSKLNGLLHIEQLEGYFCLEVTFPHMS